VNISLAVVYGMHIHNKIEFMKFTKIDNDSNNKKNTKKKNKNRKLIISLPFLNLFIKHCIWSKDKTQYCRD